MVATCAAGQIATPGDFLSATVGGWGVFGVRDKAGIVRVLRNACRHQNMQVVGTPSGNCESFRCRFHGWSYDLQGKFLGAPPPVAPKDPQAADLHLASLATSSASGIVFSVSPRRPRRPISAGAPPGLHGGTLAIEIACNWKVCVEHLLANRRCRPILAGTGRCSRYGAPGR
jgi:choline monooxygenase